MAPQKYITQYLDFYGHNTILRLIQNRIEQVDFNKLLYVGSHEIWITAPSLQRYGHASPEPRHMMVLYVQLIMVAITPGIFMVCPLFIEYL